MELLALLGTEKRAYWIHGTTVSRAFASHEILSRFSPEQRYSYDLRVHSEGQVAAALRTNRTLLGPAVHLVRNAHLWAGPVDPLRKWLNSKSADTLVLESGLTQWRPNEWLSRDEYLPDLRKFVNSSRVGLVNAEFSKRSSGRDKAQRLVEEYAGVDSWTAKLCTLNGQTTSGTLTIARRLKHFPKVPDYLVHALGFSEPPSGFVYSLLHNRKADALKASYGPSVFSELASSLDLVAMMSRNQRMGETPFALAGRLNIHRVQVEKHLPLMKFFDPSSFQRRLQVLATTSTLWERATTEQQKRAAIVALVNLW